MSRKTLIFLLLTAGALYGLGRLLWPGQRSNFFTTELVQVDTASLDRIVLHRNGNVFSLKREQEGWIASKGAMHLPAVQSVVDELLGALSGAILTHGMVAQNPEDWGKYGVGENQGVRVQLYQSKILQEDFVLGGVSDAATFLRFSGQRSVYEVEAMPLDLIGRDYSAYRNPNLLELSEGEQITAFEWQFPDTLYAFSRSGNNWVCNNIALDSAKVAHYLGGLRHIASRTFADDFDEVEAGRFAFRTLSITSNRAEAPYTIECFRDTLSRPVYFFRSGSQAEVFFAEDSTGLYRRMFKNLTDLITDNSSQ